MAVRAPGRQPSAGAHRSRADRRPLPIRGRRVLVTGAGGFIGRHVCRRLVEAGAEVHGVSRRRRAARDGVRWRRGDLTDARRTRALLAAVDPEYVVHLAGYPYGAQAPEAVLPNFAGNAVATVQLLAAIDPRRCRRIVLAGSMEAPALFEPGAAALTPHAVSKRVAALYGRLYGAQFGLPIVQLRLFMVYGPGQDGPHADKLIPYTIRSLLAGRRPRVTHGRRRIDWVYVDDVVDAVLRALTTPGITGREFDVASGRRLSIRELVDQLIECVGGGRAHYGGRPERAIETEPVARLGPSRRLLGWRPRVGLSEGLARTVEWHRRQHAGTGGPVGRPRVGVAAPPRGGPGRARRE
ncbi:MAG TPA: NAD-dependent epimerase/dehydratase family protein [Acidiferrobacterales bacterium]